MSKWMEKLDPHVLERLGNCCSRKSDIGPLTEARWAWMRETGKDKEGFIKEDALVYVLELLDCNGQFFDLSRDEYDDLCA